MTKPTVTYPVPWLQPPFHSLMSKRSLCVLPLAVAGVPAAEAWRVLSMFCTLT